jgi:hypothetical protein
MLEGDPGTVNIDYLASGQASSLAFETNNGNRWVTEATISSPVPSQFKACQASDSRCGGSNRSPANVGSFRFIANAQTTLNVFDCATPLNSSCNSPNTASTFTHVNNLRLKTLIFDGHAQNCCLFNQQAQGHLYLTTVPPGMSNTLANADTMSGSIRSKTAQEFTLTFGSGFKAANRLSVFTRFPSLPFSSQSITKTGLITCSSGTAISIKVQILGLFTLNLNGTTLLC